MSLEKINQLEGALLDELSKLNAQIKTSRENSSYNGIPLISDEGYSSLLRKLFNEYTLYLVSLVEKNEINQYKTLLNAKHTKAQSVQEQIEFFRREQDGELTNFLGIWDKVKTKFHEEGMGYWNTYNKVKGQIEARKSVLQMVGFQVEYINKLLEFYESQVSNHISFGNRNATVEDGQIIYNPQQYNTRISWLSDYKTFVGIISLLQKYEYIDNLNSEGYSKLLSLMNFAEYDLPSNLMEETSDTILFSNNDGLVKWKKGNKEFAEFYWTLIEVELIEGHGEKDLKDLVRNFMGIIEFSAIRKTTKDALGSLTKAISIFPDSEEIKSRKSKRMIGKHLRTFFPKNK